MASFTNEVNGNSVQFFSTTEAVVSYHWDFGDGTESGAESPTHIYEQEGTYVVTLLVQGVCGEGSFVNEVTIDTGLPIVGFNFDGAEGCSPLTVQYFNSSTNADSLYWEFPGGLPENSSVENPVVFYSEAGVYSASLFAFNQNGNSTLTQVDVVIVSDIPVVAFEINMDGDSVSFTNQSNNADTYFWDFGDGTSSEEEHPTHNYEVIGSYLVTLTATNACGAAEISEEVSIIDGVGELEQLTSFEVYPVPNRGIFSLDLQGQATPAVTFYFYDVTGRLIWQSTDDFSLGALHKEVDLQQLPQGVYFLKLDYLNNGFYKKIIIVN